MPDPAARAKTPSNTGAIVVNDRRAPRGGFGPWRWLCGLLARPLRLERRGLQLHILLGERREAPAAGARRSPTLEQLREELRERLLSQDTDHAARVMRHLVFVHHELNRNGWRGVELLPAPVLGKALVQAQMLATTESTPVLQHVIDRLHKLHTAALLREERRVQLQAEGPARVEVTETTHEEFEMTERSWLGVAPAEVPPRRPQTGGA